MDIRVMLDDILDQLQPPPYIFTTTICDNYVSFCINKKIDTSNIDNSDPIVDLLLKHCVYLEADTEHNRFIFQRNIDYKHPLSPVFKSYILNFLTRVLPNANPRTTKLYKWFKYYGEYHRLFNDMALMYRYLHQADLSNPANVHTKNGLALLSNIQKKYTEQNNYI